jgi:hypothetical protein
MVLSEGERAQYNQPRVGSACRSFELGTLMMTCRSSLFHNEMLLLGNNSCSLERQI